MSNELDVQEKRLNAMKVKILRAEQENLKTREKTSEQMVDTMSMSIKTSIPSFFKILNY